MIIFPLEEVVVVFVVVVVFTFPFPSQVPLSDFWYPDLHSQEKVEGPVVRQSSVCASQESVLQGLIGLHSNPSPSKLALQLHFTELSPFSQVASGWHWKGFAAQKSTKSSISSDSSTASTMICSISANWSLILSCSEIFRLNLSGLKSKDSREIGSTGSQLSRSPEIPFVKKSYDRMLDSEPEILH